MEDQTPMKFKNLRQFINSVAKYIAENQNATTALFEALYMGQKTREEIMVYRMAEKTDAGEKLVMVLDKEIGKKLKGKTKEARYHKSLILDAIASLDTESYSFKDGWLSQDYPEYIDEIKSAKKGQVERFGGRQGLR